MCNKKRKSRGISNISVSQNVQQCKLWKKKDILFILPFWYSVLSAAVIMEMSPLWESDLCATVCIHFTAVFIKWFINENTENEFEYFVKDICICELGIWDLNY